MPSRLSITVSTTLACLTLPILTYADTPSTTDTPATTAPPSPTRAPATPTPPSPPSPAPYFTIAALGTADQVASDLSPGINAKGHAAVWRLSEKSGYRPVITGGKKENMLDAPAGYENEFAYSLNDHDDAVGWANTTRNPVDSLSTTHAFLVHKNKPSDLGTLGGKNSQAYAINNSGIVVGVSQIDEKRHQRAFRYSGGKMTALDPLDTGTFSIAFALNEAGVVAGGSSVVIKDLPIQPVHAVIWKDKVPEDLGTLVPNRSSIAYAINNHNDVVGVADTPTDQTVFIYSQGHMTDLDIKGRAYSINDNRQAVGTEEGEERGYMVGWLWDNGNTYKLNDCIDKTSGYWVEAGHKINNAGQIICTGRLQKRVHFLLLTPAKRPS